MYVEASTRRRAFGRISVPVLGLVGGVYGRSFWGGGGATRRQAAPVYQRDLSGLFKKIQKTPSELGGDAETSAASFTLARF